MRRLIVGLVEESLMRMDIRLEEEEEGVFWGDKSRKQASNNFLWILLCKSVLVVLVDWWAGTCHGRSCSGPSPNPKSVRCYQSATRSIGMMTMLV